MRITNRMLANNYLKDVNGNLKNLNKINTQLSTGKEISRPSDNPFKTVRSMQLTTNINTNAQYKTNIDDTNSWLDATDTALSQVNASLQRVRELMVSAGNAAYGSNECKTINEEIKERVAELSQILNSSFDGRYLFGGSKTTSKPLTATDAYDGNVELNFVDKNGEKINVNSTELYDYNQTGALSQKMSVEISQGVYMEYNVTAMEILKFNNSKGEKVDLMNLFDELQTNLLSGKSENLSKVIGENLAGIDSAIENVLKLRSEVGAKQNRMESALSKNEDESYNMTQVLSNTEDIDFTKKTIEYSMAQTTYTAALQVSAQVLPKTLLDYL
ncbi:MAG: flagellar hook-associated protein 3 [Clostridium sp.]|nr:flagellar hook-associated protein 3 [Clostridium sp.]